MPTRKNAMYNVEAHSPEGYTAYTSRGGLAPAIDLVGGNLYVNNQLIPDVKWEGGLASWNHATSKADISSGLLYFSDNRNWFNGHITLPFNQYPNPTTNNNRSTALANPHHLFTTEVRGSSLSTYICDTEEEAVAAAHSTDTTFFSSADKDAKVPPVSYGVKFNEETNKAEMAFTVGGVDWMQEFGQSLDKDLNAVISFIYNSNLVKFVIEDNKPQYPLCPAGGCVTMHWDNKVFWGYAKIYDTVSNLPSEKFYAFKGTVQPEPLKAAHVRLNHTVYKTALLGAEKSLSVAELRGLTVSDTLLQETANKLMVVAMKYHASETILDDFFGEVRPSIDHLTFMKDAVKSADGKKFWTEFLVPYLGSGLNEVQGAAKPKRTMTEDEKKKLTYYLNVGLTKNKEYNNQNYYVYQQAYVNTVPRIAEYLTDQAKNPKNRFYWADQLYAELKEGETIKNLARVVAQTGDYSAIKRYTFLLELLGRPEHSEEFGKSIIALAIPSTINDVDAKQLMKPYTGILKRFIEDFSQHPESHEPGILNRYYQAKALADAAAHLGSIDNLGRAIMEGFVAVRQRGATIAATIGAHITRLAHIDPVFFGYIQPALEYYCKGVLATCFAAGVYSLALGWSNVKNMDTFEIIELSGRTALFAGEFALGLPEFGRVVAIGGKFVWKVVMKGVAWLAATDLGKAFAACMTCLNPGNWAGVVAQYIGAGLDAIGAGLAYLYNLVKPAIKVLLECLGPIIAMVAALTSIYHFVLALQSGSPSAVLDGVLMSLAILQAVVVVLNVFIPSTFLSFFGVAVAIAAVIVALVQVFTPPPPPPSPTNKFMDGTFYPWLKKQEDPPADYKPPTINK